MKTLVLILMFSAYSLIINAQTYYVTPAGSGTKNGTSWNNAFDNAGFRTALKSASYGTSFWICEGTYYTESNRDSSFNVPIGVKLYGGFPATGLPTMAQRDWNAHPTIFNGDVNNDDLPGLTGTGLMTNGTRQDNTYHLIKLINTDSNTVVDGFFIKNGNTNGNNSGGAGITVNFGGGVIRNCIFRMNGGRAVSDSIGINVQIDHCAFDSNYMVIKFTKGSVFMTYCSLSYNFQEGIISNLCSLMVKGCTFKGYTYTYNAPYFFGGGVISIDSCSFYDATTNTNGPALTLSGRYGDYISNSSFYNSSITAYDTILVRGCVFNYNNGSTADITHGRLVSCIFNGMNISNRIINSTAAIIDSCTFSNITGGYTMIQGTPIQINNTNFLNNTASAVGVGSSNISLNNCLFKNNKRPVYSESFITVNNCSFINNTNSSLEIYGGGLIQGCKFISNSSLSRGGAINYSYNQLKAKNQLDISNSFFYQNTSQLGGALYSTGLTNLNNCVFKNNSATCAGAVFLKYDGPTPPSVSNVRNCTFYGNYADSLAGNFYIEPYALAHAVSHMYNSIMWGSRLKNLINNIYAPDANLTLKNNLVQIQDGGLSSNIIATNLVSSSHPRFRDTSNIIGPDSIWGTIDDGLNLLSCSPAINSGDSNLNSTPLLTDITGNSRIYGSNIDFGAYEFVGTKSYVTPRTIVTINSQDTSVCSNRSITIHANTINSGSGAIFTWKKNGQLFLTGTDSNITSPAYLFQNGDTINLAVTSSNCFNPTDTFSNPFMLHINPIPTAGFSINNPNQCLTGNNFVFTDTSKISSGTLTRLWSLSTGDTSSTNPFVKNFLLPGDFTVLLKSISNNGCVASALKSIKVNPSPTAGFTINNPSQCLNNNNFIFTDTSLITSGSLSRLWKISNGDTSSANPFTKTFKLSGDFSVQLKLTSNAGCVDSVIKPIKVYPSPTSGFTINNPNQCLTENTFIFTDTSKISTGSISRLWSLSTGDTSSTNPYTKTFALTGTFSVKLKSTSTDGCMDSSFKYIKVNPNPTALFTINNPNQCLQENNFIFTDISNGSHRLWHLSTGDSSTANPWTKTFLSAGTFSVQLKSTSDFGCVDSISKTVTVKPNPERPLITQISTTMLQSSVATVYQWYLNGDTIPFAKSQVLTITQNGTYNVKIDSTNGCSAISDSFYVFNVGIKESIFKNENIYVYPNPATTEVNLYFSVPDFVLFELQDYLGHVIKTESGIQGHNSVSFETSELSNGIYFLKVTDRNANHQLLKIVVNR